MEYVYVRKWDWMTYYILIWLTLLIKNLEGILLEKYCVLAFFFSFSVTEQIYSTNNFAGFKLKFNTNPVSWVILVHGSSLGSSLDKMINYNVLSEKINKLWTTASKPGFFLASILNQNTIPSDVISEVSSWCLYRSSALMSLLL